LKLNTQEFIPHFFSLEGNELYIYRDVTDKEHKYMHCLVGCYLGDLDEDEGNKEEFKDKTGQERSYFELKINIPPNGLRHLYFETEGERKGWKEKL